MIGSYPNIPNELKLYKNHPSVKFNIINACKQFYLRFNDQFEYEHGVTKYRNNTNDTNDTNKYIIDIPINDTGSVLFKVGEYVQKIFNPSGGKSKKKRKRRTSKKLKKTRKRKNR